MENDEDYSQNELSLADSEGETIYRLVGSPVTR